MTSESWITIFGVNALSIEFGDATARRGFGVHQLTIPISVRATDDAAHGKNLTFEGEAYVDGLRGGGGYLGRFTRTRPQSLRANGKIQDSLLLELSTIQINEVESRRTGGFSLHLNLDVYADTGEFGSTQHNDYRVSRETWIQILEQVNFRKTLLIELAIPDSSVNPEMERAVEYFNDAQRRFLEGDNRQAVECLRQSLAAIVGADPTEEEGSDDISSDLKRARSTEAPYSDRIELVRRALKLLSDLGGHPKVEETRPREARAAITMVCGLLQWYLVKP